MYIPSCGWRVYRTEIWECEKILVRRGQPSILARRGHTSILARRGHASILARRGTHLNPGQERTHLDLRENISMANSILLRYFEARSLDSEKNEENQWN